MNPGNASRCAVDGTNPSRVVGLSCEFRWMFRSASPEPARCRRTITAELTYRRQQHLVGDVPETAQAVCGPSRRNRLRHTNPIARLSARLSSSGSRQFCRYANPPRRAARSERSLKNPAGSAIREPDWFRPGQTTWETRERRAGSPRRQPRSGGGASPERSDSRVSLWGRLLNAGEHGT
jgi:hypothetical protein